MSTLARHWSVVRQALADERERTAGRVAVEETDFLPAALEIVEQPVSPTGRITAWVLLIGLLVVIAWLVFGKVDVVASAAGKVIPASNVQLVQPTEQGVVRQIHVEDGQHVRKGQPLITLDPTVSAAEAIQAEKAMQTAQLDAARNRAVLGAVDGQGMHFSPPLGVPAEVAATQLSYAKAQVAQVQAQIAARSADRGAAQAALAEAQVQAAKLTETLPLLDQQIAANQLMLDRGYVSKLKVIEMQRQRLSTARDRDAALETARRQRSEILAATSTRDQARQEARTTILSDINKAEAESKLRAEELSKASMRSSLQVLRAPVDGVVAQLAVHTVGGVVEAAKPIMLVVPEGGLLVAKVKVLNRDVGGVRRGQPVAIKVEAFPFTKYGTVIGHVLNVSSDATEDEHLGLIYDASIAIDPNAKALAERKLRLSSGMAVTADIRVGRRSIISYLVSPLDAIFKDAAREQ